MEISESFVAKAAFIVGGVLCLLPLVSLYFPPSAMPEVLMLVGLAGMSWHTAGLLLLRGLEKARFSKAKASEAYLADAIAKRLGRAG